MALDTFATTPAGSIVALEERERESHITELAMLPRSIRAVATSPKTGAFIRGLAKQFQLNENLAETIAFSVWRAFVGDIALAQLPALLSTELKIANDKAQRLAQEIERDLFAPVALELNQHLAQKKKQMGSITKKLGNRATPRPHKHQAPPRFPRKPAAPPNILNLKDNKKPPTPPPIP